MSKPIVYLETTVVGYLAARQQSDIVIASRQLSSQSWWETRDSYRLVVSQIVVDECSAGDATAAADRLSLIDGVQILGVSSDARQLASELMAQHAIPSTEPRDALHISISAVNGVQFLVTWNFRHIANAVTRSTIEQVCRDCGYSPPSICSPDELLGR